MGLKYKIAAFLGMALFHFFVSLVAFARPEDEYVYPVYPDQIEEELKKLNSVDERYGVVQRFHKGMRLGFIAHNNPQVIHALENALTDTDEYVIGEALAALRYTNASSAKDAVGKLLTNEELPFSGRQKARDIFFEIQDNQRSFEQFLKDFKSERNRFDLIELARDMSRFFDREKNSSHFRIILNGNTESLQDYYRKNAVMSAIALSRDETLKNAFLHDFLRHARTGDIFGLGNNSIAYLAYFDSSLTSPHLFSIIEDKNIDEDKKKEAIKVLLHKLPPGLFDDTIKKIRDGIKDDPFSKHLTYCLDYAIKTWKEEHNIDEASAEKTNGNNENTNEDQSPSSEENTKEVMLPCIEVSKESHLEEMVKNVSDITERLESNSLAENQRENEANKAQRIENRLKNALERLETDTAVYQVAVEPTEKEIRRLNNEINGHFPGTLKRAATEVAEVFGYNEFGTHESRRMEIRKKEFEIQKKEREILNSAIEELKNAYNEGVLFFNSYSSIREKSFHPICLNRRELSEKSQEMLLEFSKLRSSQKK